MKQAWLIIFGLFVALITNAQLPFCYSPNQQLLSLNPAFAGTNKYLRIQGIATGYLSSHSNADRYLYGGIDGLLDKKHHALGVSGFYGRYGIGALSEYKIDLTYAYHFTIKQKIRIVIAAQGSFFKLNLDRSKLGFGDLIDPRRGFTWNTNEIIPAQSKYNADFSTGILAYGRQYFFGVGVYSFTQPDEGLLGVLKRPIINIFQGGYRFNINAKFNMDFYEIVKQTTNKNTEQFLQFGTNMNFQGFTIHMADRINKLSIYNGIITGLNFNIVGFKIGANTILMYAKNQNAYVVLEGYASMNFGYKREKKAVAAGTNSPGPVRLFF